MRSRIYSNMLRTWTALPARAWLRALGSALPALAVAVVVLASATDFFPDTALVPGVPLISMITPLRLVICGGLIALLCTGARLSTLRTRIDIPIGVLLLVSTVGTVAGRWPGAPLRELFVEVAVFYLAVGLRRTRPESWAAVSMLALVSVSIAGSVAFAQVTNQTFTGFCGGGFFGDEVTCAHGAMIRAEGTFSNPNELAAFLLLLAPLAALAVTLVTEKLTRVVLIGLTVVGSAAVLTTFSRGAYGAIVVSLLVAAARRPLSRLSRYQVTLIPTAGTLVLAGSGMVIAVLAQHNASLGLREKAWTAALREALAHPVLGVGLGRAGSVITAETGTQFAHVHNLWLNWLVETGVPGLLAITTITVVGVVSAARLASQGSATGTAELAGLSGFLVTSLLDDPANLSRIALAMWLMIGLIMAETPARWRDPFAPARAETSGPPEHTGASSTELPELGRPSAHENDLSATQPIPAVPARPSRAAETRVTARKPPPPGALGETPPTPPVPRRSPPSPPRSIPNRHAARRQGQSPPQRPGNGNPPRP
jgi:O-antigen ligase